MCGIFGFSGRNYPDKEIMREIAYLAGTRGCHSNGIAWLTPDGAIQTKKRLGKIDPSTIYEGVTSKAIIGHCRLSTSGPPTLANAQPLATSSMAIAHNGTIRNYGELAKGCKVQLLTQCDSELLLHINPERLFDRLSNDPYAYLVIANGQISARRRDMPLYELKTADGTYWCSRKFRDATLIINQKQKEQ